MSEAIDTSELVKLSHSFTVAAARMPAESRAVVSRGGATIKTETRENVSTNPRWRRLAGSVNYDMTGNAFYSQAEIGYDKIEGKRGSGDFGVIAEFGTARKAPHPALIPAFEHEAPLFEKAMSDLAAKVIGDAL